MPPSTSDQSRRSGWRLILEATKPHKGQVIVGVIAGMVWTLCKVSVPTLVREAIDQGILLKHHAPGVLARWSLIIVGVGVVSAACVGIRRYLAFGTAWRTETELRQRLFAHLQRLHFAFHDQSQTGQLMSRAATDLQQIQGFVVLIPITISNFLTVLLVTVILLRMNAGLALLALGTLPLVNVAAKRFSSQVHPVSMELQQELAGVATVVEETVTGIRVIKGFGAESLQSTRLRDRAGRVYDRAVKAASIRAAFNPIIDFFPTIGMIAVLWYGGHQVVSHHLTIGALLAFNVYVALLVWPLRMLGMLIAQAQRAVASAERVHEILSTAPAIVDGPDAQPLPAGAGEVRFEQVRFGYVPGAAHPVLDGLDLVVRPGEAVALVGATGCGKTTVARLIPRFYDVVSGSVRLDGVDVRQLVVKELRQAVGIVFEDTFLFTDSVRANIAFAQPDAAQSRVEWAARRAGAHDFIVDLPDGYDPRVLILDDATSSVDPTKEHEISAALADVMAGRTTIVIAHRPATIALADRVVLMDEGKVIAEGTHDDLLATNAHYRWVLAQAAERDAALTDEDVAV